MRPILLDTLTPSLLIATSQSLFSIRNLKKCSASLPTCLWPISLSQRLLFMLIMNIGCGNNYYIEEIQCFDSSMHTTSSLSSSSSLPSPTYSSLSSSSPLSSTISSGPYQHGLSRYYQSPLSTTTTYQMPSNSLSNTLSSYSISLPVQHKYLGPFSPSFYHHQHHQQPSLKYAPKRSQYYTPRPQYCPETGRTLCSRALPYYPLDEVYLIVKMARAKRFNISSEFIDESENDNEPYFDDYIPYDYNDEVDDYSFTGQPYQENDNIENGNIKYNNDNRDNNGTQDEQLNKITNINNINENNKMGNNRNAAIVQHFHNLDWKFLPQKVFSISNNNRNRNTANTVYNKITPQYGSVKSISSNTNSPLSSPIMNHQYQLNGNGHGRYKRQASDTDVFIEPLCASRTIVMEPKAALNDRRQWKYVVNLAERDKRLRQAIKVEVCM